MTTEITYKKEFLRKTIHLSSIWIPILYFFIEKKQMALILLNITVIYLILDYLRLKSNKLNFLNKMFNSILRTHEKDKRKRRLTGASFMLMSSLIVIYLFPKNVAILAISILIISDSAAALIGKRFGKHRIFEKSFEGSLSFFISGILVILVIGIAFEEKFNYYLISSLSLIIGTIIELFSKKINIDDNFSIPVMIALTYSLLAYIFS